MSDGEDNNENGSHMSDGEEEEEAPPRFQFTDHQRNLAATLARCASARTRNEQTKASAKAKLLWRQVGGSNFKILISSYIEQIRVGINANYVGPKLFRGHILMHKQALFDAVYKREIRDHVMKKIYLLFKHCVEPGAFARVLMTDEDFRSLEQGKTVVDESVAIQEDLKYLINQLKCDVEASTKLLESLQNGVDLGDIDIGSDVNDGDEYDSDEKLPPYIPPGGYDINIHDQENVEEDEFVDEANLPSDPDRVDEEDQADLEEARMKMVARHEKPKQALPSFERRQIAKINKRPRSVHASPPRRRKVEKAEEPVDIDLVSPPLSRVARSFKSPKRLRLNLMDFDDTPIPRVAEVHLDEIFDDEQEIPQAPRKKKRVVKRNLRFGSD